MKIKRDKRRGIHVPKKLIDGHLDASREDPVGFFRVGDAAILRRLRGMPWPWHNWVNRFEISPDGRIRIPAFNLDFLGKEIEEYEVEGTADMIVMRSVVK